MNEQYIRNYFSSLAKNNFYSSVYVWYYDGFPIYGASHFAYPTEGKAKAGMSHRITKVLREKLEEEGILELRKIELESDGLEVDFTKISGQNTEN